MAIRHKIIEHHVRLRQARVMVRDDELAVPDASQMVPLLSLHFSRTTETAFRITDPNGGMGCSGGVHVRITGPGFWAAVWGVGVFPWDWQKADVTRRSETASGERGILVLHAFTFIIRMEGR